MKKYKICWLKEGIGCFMATFIFVLPFLFMLFNSLKSRPEANRLSFSLPTELHFQNYIEVFTNNNYQIVMAFKNSAILTLGAVTLLIFFCSMAGYVIQRRRSGMTKIANLMVMIGLMLPPSILPTIWLLKIFHIYKTMFAMILIETSLLIPFTIMLYRGFVGIIPVELEEAAYIDGCSSWKVFFRIIFPLLKPVTATVIILNAVTVFNDFTNPLYFLPGYENSTVQLTLFNYKGTFQSSYNLLFADIIIIIVPMLILFLIFNRRIVEGMVAGSVKG
ncbi:carbohydrate ABC transporter permease [Robinsoniella peoriensis]|uniref:carbohydrate ABC transporter permease n=1 Tax=Robinsoniella peoriensis TaxID=180332 RepID=UPI0036408F23